MAETQGEMKHEVSGSGCSAWKRREEQSGDAAPRGAIGTRPQPAPLPPPCRTPLGVLPALPPHRPAPAPAAVSFPSEAPAEPSPKPGCLRPQQLPPMSVRDPSPEGPRKPRSCEASGGMQADGLCHPARSLLPHPPHHGHARPPGTGRGRAAPCHRPG